MAYYYIKNGGTATGDAGRATTARTGSFATMGASAYYNNLDLLLDTALSGLTAPASGDVVCVSDQHNYSQSANNELFYGVLAERGLTVMSVDDTACNTYKAGATEDSTALGGSRDMVMYRNIIWLGMTLGPADWTNFTNATHHTFYDCRLNFASGNGISMEGDGATVRLFNTDIEFEGATSYMRVSAAGYFEWNYGQLIGTSLNQFTNAGFVSGGGTVKLRNVDLSSVTGDIIDVAGSDFTNDDMILIELSNCKLNASVTIMNENPVRRCQRILVTNSASSSGSAEHQYMFQTAGGKVESDTSKYRDNTTAFPSTETVSLKCTTLTNVAQEQPFEFDFPGTRFAELSSTSSDVLRIHFLCANALDDGDVWAEVYYPDGTNEHESNLAQSVASSTTVIAPDPFRTAGSLSTNTETWTGRTTENRYHIDLDTSGNAGADCVPHIRVYIGKASETIYFCPTLELS